MSDGIISQYGFLFQRYAFIENVINNAAMNLFFTYEGVDDIDVSDAKAVDMLAMASVSNKIYNISIIGLEIQLIFTQQNKSSLLIVLRQNPITNNF